MNINDIDFDGDKPVIKKENQKYDSIKANFAYFVKEEGIIKKKQNYYFNDKDWSYKILSYIHSKSFQKFLCFKPSFDTYCFKICRSFVWINYFID